MSTNKIVQWCACLLTVASMSLHSSRLLADTIEFPESELASESVLPVFDHPESVKARRVQTAHRIELGGFGGYALTEPFYNPMSFGVMATYHLNEVSGLNLAVSANVPGLSDYGNQLNPIPGTSANLNIQYAPAPKYLALLNYQYTGFYGKLSLTKNYVMNLSLYGLLGAGAIGIGDSVRPVVSAGLGQKFYLSQSFALRFDLRMLMYQGPDGLSRDLSSATTTASASTFSDKLQFSSLLSLGAVYLLPAL